jgi:hypothetical protein
MCKTQKVTSPGHARVKAAWRTVFEDEELSIAMSTFMDAISSFLVENFNSLIHRERRIVSRAGL